jgi:ketosteroid isomerase-like protein
VGEQVLVLGRFKGRGTASGVAVEYGFAQLITLRDHEIVRWEHFASEAQALEAAGLSE